jgi:hypothetical protein
MAAAFSAEATDQRQQTLPDDDYISPLLIPGLACSWGLIKDRFTLSGSPSPGRMPLDGGNGCPGPHVAESARQEASLTLSAAKAGMDRKTARRYRYSDQLPSQRRADAPPRDWRTRPDPFADVWGEVVELLEQATGWEAKTLFEEVQRRHPGRFADGQLRTLQCRVKQWRATHGPDKEMFFTQDNPPGRLGASDFTHMTELGVTIQGQPFAHLVYHFVMTHSNWEHVTVCFTESFESFSAGFQNAILGPGRRAGHAPQ